MHLSSAVTNLGGLTIGIHGAYKLFWNYGELADQHTRTERGSIDLWAVEEGAGRHSQIMLSVFRGSTDVNIKAGLACRCRDTRLGL